MSPCLYSNSLPKIQPLTPFSPSDIYFNTYNGLWLLPPNKTEATAYLDGDAPKPPRYARIFGTANCFDREFMIGYAKINYACPACPG